MIRKAVTMKNIAEKFNISNVTVSKALSGKDGVSTQLRQEISAYAKEIGYIYNDKSDKTDKNKTFHIGVIVAERFFNTTKSFYLEMYKHLTETLSGFGYFNKLEVAGKKEENNLVLPSVLKGEKVDGIIILGQMKDEYLNMIISSAVPVVFLDFYSRNTNVPYVISDSFYGSYMLTNYLVDKGHKEIGFVGSINSTSSIEDRYLGFYKSLLENGLKLNADYIIEDRNTDGESIDFVLPHKMPTAFVCNCDETAFHFIACLKKNGYRVPEDISIVGFDNYIYSTVCEPKITTVAVNMKKMTRAAVLTLIHTINKENNPTDRIMIADKLIERDSVKDIS